MFLSGDKPPHLGLHEGRYVIHASAVSSDLSEVFHWLENQCEFSVVPSQAGIGIARLRFEWRFDDVTVREQDLRGGDLPQIDQPTNHPPAQRARQAPFERTESP